MKRLSLLLCAVLVAACAPAQNLHYSIAELDSLGLYVLRLSNAGFTTTRIETTVARAEANMNAYGVYLSRVIGLADSLAAHQVLLANLAANKIGVGPASAGQYARFAGPDTLYGADVAGGSGSDSLGYIEAMRYGAVPDSTDQTANLNAAAVAARTQRRPLQIASGPYRISSTVTFQDIDVDARGAKFYVVDSTITAVRVYINSEYNREKTIWLPDVLKIGSNWGEATDGVGVELKNVKFSKVRVGTIQYFKTGLRLTTGADSATAYNNIYCTRFFDNKIGIDIRPQGTIGWINQNAFWGGGFFMESTRANAISGTKYVWSHGLPDEGSAITRNSFYNMSFEGNPGPAYVIYEDSTQSSLYAGPYFEFGGAVNIHQGSKMKLENMFMSGADYFVFTASGNSPQVVADLVRGWNIPFVSWPDPYTSGLKVWNTGGEDHASIMVYKDDHLNNRTGATDSTWVIALCGDGLRVKAAGDATATIILGSDGSVTFTGLPTFADNAAAAALPTGRLYRTSTGSVMVKY